MNVKSRKFVVITGLLLLVWFFFDMIGLAFGDSLLVSRSWKQDGIFFVIYLISFLWFIFKVKSGKYVLLSCNIILLVYQIYSHWCFTILGPWEGLNKTFADTIKIFNTNEVYIPDLYHIILQILIILTLISTIFFVKKKKQKRYKNNNYRNYESIRIKPNCKKS